MIVVVTGKGKSTAEAMAGFKLDNHSLKSQLIVDADTESDVSTRKSFPSREAEFYVSNLRCSAVCVNRMQWKHNSLDGYSRDRAGIFAVPDAQRRGPERTDVNTWKRALST